MKDIELNEISFFTEDEKLIVDSFKEYENIVLKQPSDIDLKETEGVSDKNRKIIANLHNLKKRVLLGTANITSQELMKIEDLCKSLLIGFVNVDYSESEINSKLLKNSSS